MMTLNVLKFNYVNGTLKVLKCDLLMVTLKISYVIC